MSVYDLLIIGAGPGGYESAIRAGKLGLKTLLIEKEKLGGVCLNAGCIPTKTILASVHFLEKLKKANLFNIKLGEPVLDYPKVIERKDRLIKRLQLGIEKQLQGGKVEIVYGQAELWPDKLVKVGGKEYTAKNIMLAAGTEPADLPGLKADNQKIFNSTQILNLQVLPKTFGIIGAGAIGLEFADIFSSLGVAVTVTDILEKILPQEDTEAVSLLVKMLEHKGVKFNLGPLADKFNPDNYEKVLVAAGRKINNEFIKDQQIKLGPKKQVLVNEYMETSLPGIFAVGDINDLALYAHAATYQGLKVVENIYSRKPKKIDLSNIPKVIFTGLQLASVGRTDGVSQMIKKLPLLMLGKAQAENQTEGFLKLFIEQKTDLIQGAVIVADNADALIGEALVLVNNKVTTRSLSDLIHPHPTYAEIFTESLK